MKKQWIDILTVLGMYAIMFGATCFMWIGAEFVVDGSANLGTIDMFFAAYFAWSIVRAMANVGKRIQEKNHDKSVQV